MLLAAYCKTIDTTQTMERHPSWFPTGRTDGEPPTFDKDNIGCQLFRFPLNRRYNWQPKHRCIFFAT
jgi:hypothetical protein